jgi:hypothetical protein
MENNGLLLEKYLTDALQSIEGLRERVCPVIDIQHSTGPIVSYEQQDESEENAIDGLSGLRSAVFKIHALHGTYQKMRLLSEQVKTTILALRQSVTGNLHIEEVSITLASPDLYESRVRQFRRSYKVTIQYQIKED